MNYKLARVERRERERERVGLSVDICFLSTYEKKVDTCSPGLRMRGSVSSIINDPWTFSPLIFFLLARFYGRRGGFFLSVSGQFLISRL